MNLDQAPSSDKPLPSPTGLPGLRKWWAVYVVVLGILALWIALLTVLPRLFS